MNILINDIRCVSQIALLGAVTANLRAVTVSRDCWLIFIMRMNPLKLKWISHR